MEDFFYGSNWNLAVRPCGLLVGIRPVAQLADSWWNTMDPTQTLPLLPWRERGQSVCMCVERGDGEVVAVVVVVGGYSPAPKRFVSAKRFPCPSQMAGFAPPLVVEKEEQKGTQRQKRHLCVCFTNKLSLWSIYGLDLFYTECNLHSITDKNASWNISNAGSGEKSYWAKQNPMTPLKELAFPAHGGKNDSVRETGKGSWAKSEATGEGNGISTDCTEALSKFNVMLRMP